MYFSSSQPLIQKAPPSASETDDADDGGSSHTCGKCPLSNDNLLSTEVLLTSPVSLHDIHTMTFICKQFTFLSVNWSLTSISPSPHNIWKSGFYFSEWIHFSSTVECFQGGHFFRGIFGSIKLKFQPFCVLATM